MIETDLLASLVHGIAHALRVARCSLLRLDSQTQTLHLAAGVGLPAGLEPFEIGLGERIAGQVASRREPLLVPSGAERLLDQPHGGYRSDALISVPVEANGELLGVLSVTDRIDDTPFDQQDLALLESFADHAGSALELLRSHHTLLELSESDELTGLWNYRHLQRRIIEEIARAERAGSSLAIMMMDLNGFKQINDTYGHPFGNEVLRLASDRLKKSMRRSDILTRYGGDEFVAILPGADVRAAVALAHRLLTAVAEPVEAELRHDLLEPASLSLSIGIAFYPETHRGATALMELADRAVYAAKAHPTHSICVAYRDAERSEYFECE
ncbi:MAG TPA: sensor domain-containing diguanylate cyclase [Ardenticatenaceae bacterium]|nr:sensor domain-containing diguanylate cyclase [Ardenticatenaceae bacterium]